MSEINNKEYLAMYGFRSKQEYIYRTNKMREITGASDLMAGLFDDFLHDNKGRCDANFNIRNDWREKLKERHGKAEEIDDVKVALSKGNLDGVVIFEGGGNLCVLYKDKSTYKKANILFSRSVLNKGYNLALLVGGVEWISDKNKLEAWKNQNEQIKCETEFAINIARVHEAQDLRKRTSLHRGFVNALPFTACNRSSFQPIVGYLDEKERILNALNSRVKNMSNQINIVKLYKRGVLSATPDKKRYACSKESILKRIHYATNHKNRDSISNGTWLDDVTTEKGKESLLAAVYVDGNSMGNKLKESGKSLSAMRKFSVSTNKDFVEETQSKVVKAINQLSNKDWNSVWDNTSGDDPGKNYRVIVDHGDEMTFICNAHAVPAVVNAYFKALESTNTACMGIAIFHSHDPFSEVYKIAEECCEQGKKRNRKCIQQDKDADASYVDFHFCRSGITGTLETIRQKQEADLIMRPYRYSAYKSIKNTEGADTPKSPYEGLIDIGKILHCSTCKRNGGISRGDVKALGVAAAKGKARFLLEWERVKAKDLSLKDAEKISELPIWNDKLPENIKIKDSDEILMKSIFDISGFFDIWFAHGEYDLPKKAKSERGDSK